MPIDPQNSEIDAVLFSHQMAVAGVKLTPFLRERYRVDGAAEFWGTVSLFFRNASSTYIVFSFTLTVFMLSASMKHAIEAVRARKRAKRARRRARQRLYAIVRQLQLIDE